MSHYGHANGYRHDDRRDNYHDRRYGRGGWRKEGESEREDDFWENRRAVRASIACPKGVWGRSPSPHSRSRRKEGEGKAPVNKESGSSRTKNGPTQPQDEFGRVVKGGGSPSTRPNGRIGERNTERKRSRSSSSSSSSGTSSSSSSDSSEERKRKRKRRKAKRRKERKQRKKEKRAAKTKREQLQSQKRSNGSGSSSSDEEEGQSAASNLAKTKMPPPPRPDRPLSTEDYVSQMEAEEAERFKQQVQGYRQKTGGDDSDGDDAIGPRPLPSAEDLDEARGGSLDYGGALRPGEGAAIAQFVQKNMRIPRRGEVGWSGDQIEQLETSGYVMSGSRHKRMNAIRLRKENQVYTAEEKRALALITYEERQQKENAILGEFRSMLMEAKRKNNGGTGDAAPEVQAAQAK